MKNFECPFCKEDLRENLTYVEDGCTNYINYKLHGKDGWIVDSETNGNNSTENYYICKSCQKTLPDEMQEYFRNNI